MALELYPDGRIKLPCGCDMPGPCEHAAEEWIDE